MNRAGRIAPNSQGHFSFVPATLPPRGGITIDDEMQQLLLDATLLLARLDGMAYMLPNMDLFITMYLKKEALLSAQIEGTQASLENIFEYERGNKTPSNINDVTEVINYLTALHFGIAQLEKIPMSIRLIKKLHELLMKGVRGGEKQPGEFKRSQNWIGALRAPIEEASFVPPSPQHTIESMYELEKYMHEDSTMPELIKCALIHYQFETIHPFLDGNGRLGRLLITFHLLWKGVIQKPLLYLSYYFKRNRQEYYDRLNMVRHSGDYEQWIKFFLRGVIYTSKSSIEKTKSILQLQDRDKKKLWEKRISSPLAMMILDKLFYHPMVSITDIQKEFDISFQAASNLVAQFEEAGILKEITGQKRDKRYVYQEFVDILSEGTRPL